MGIKYSFVDNAVYGTEDVNEIAGCLTGAGIMPFQAKDSYNVSDLNAVTAEIVGQGTDLEGCKCTLINGGTSEMSVDVSQGIIFFESGVRLIVDSEGYNVDVTPNTEGFVTAHYSPSLQKADIVFVTELPQDGEYVNLAKISANNVLTNIRSFARSKVGTLGRNVCAEMRFTPLTTPILVEGSENCYIGAKLLDVNISDYNYAHIGESFFEDIMGFFGIQENKLFYRNYFGKIYADSFLESINNSIGSNVKVVDGELCILLSGTEASVKKVLSETNYKITLF